MASWMWLCVFTCRLLKLDASLPAGERVGLGADKGIRAVVVSKELSRHSPPQP
jgi:hypothetical protein